MLPTSTLVAFLSTTDLDRAEAFFTGTLGLPATERTPFALWLDANGTTVLVTLVEDLTPQPFTVLGWDVDAIEDVIDGLVPRGVRFERFDGMEQDGRGIWTTPSGNRVAWFKDPDGNLLSLTEH